MIDFCCKILYKICRKVWILLFPMIILYLRFWMCRRQYAIEMWPLFVPMEHSSLTVLFWHQYFQYSEIFWTLLSRLMIQHIFWEICGGHCWGSLWSTVRRQWPQHRREQPQNSLDDGNIGNVLLLMHQTFPQNRREYPHWDQFISPRHCSLLVVVGYPQWKYKQYRLQWKPSVMRLVGKTSGAFGLELPWFAWKLRQRILVWWV